MNALPFNTVDGAVRPIAGMIAEPSPELGRVLAAHSSIDLDGWSLAEARQTRLKPYWNPSDAWGRAFVALFPIGALGAIAAVIAVFLAFELLALPKPVPPFDTVLLAGAVVVGLSLAWLGGMKFTFFLSYKREGDNVFVGELGVERIVVDKKGAITRHVARYADDLAWCEGVTLYIYNGIRDGHWHRFGWIDRNGQVIFDLALTDTKKFDQRTAIKTWQMASNLRAAVRTQQLQAALARGEELRFPILAHHGIAIDRTLIYDRLVARQGSAVRWHGDQLTFDVDGRTVLVVARQDLAVDVVEGKCTFRARSTGAHLSTELGLIADGRLLLAMLS